MIGRRFVMHKLITAFLVMIGGTIGALLVSKSSDGPNFPKVPVPFIPSAAPPGESISAYRYRGLYVAVIAVPDQGYKASIYGTKNFLVEPVAVSEEITTDLLALENAMEWIDTYHDGQAIGATA